MRGLEDERDGLKATSDWPFDGFVDDSYNALRTDIVKDQALI